MWALGGAKNPTNDNGALPSLSLIKYCGVRGGGGHWGAQLLNYILVLGKTTRTPRVHLVFI